MSELKVYAIPNCNTVKKALDWLKAKKVAYVFHDYKKLGITKHFTHRLVQTSRLGSISQ